MSPMQCRQPLTLESLIAYRQAELSESEAERIEEHLFQCAACSEQLETLERLGAGVARLARGGLVFGGTTLSAVEKAAAEGLRFGVYRLEPGQSVQCTIAPGDDCNVSRFVAPLTDIERVDLSFVGTEAGGRSFAYRLDDVAVDRAHQEVVVIHPGPILRPLGHATIEIQMLTHHHGEERTLARYTLHHAPWSAGG